MAWQLSWRKSDWEPVGYIKKELQKYDCTTTTKADWGYNFYKVQGGRRNHQNVWKIGAIYAYAN